MKVGWLLDGTLFEEYHEELVEAIQRCGHLSVSMNCPNLPYTWEDAGDRYRKAFPKGACVVTHADIDLTLRVQRDAYWRPGVFATLSNYNCSHYMEHLKHFLLNSDYQMLPFHKLNDRKEYLFDTFGREGQLFIRPDSPLKFFTGQITSERTFEKDLDFMAFYEFPPDSLVVVSSPKPIAFESRFVVADGVVVAGSKNKVGDQLQIDEPDRESWRLAEEIAKSEFQPDRVWVMDICCTTEGSYHLLEIGTFSFSNLYGCDKTAVVESVSKTALSMWREYSTE